MRKYVDGFVVPVYKSREHRDSVMKKNMKDERFQDPDMVPFDGKRMIYGGFKPVVDV